MPLPPVETRPTAAAIAELEHVTLNDRACLIAALYFEAGGEGAQGLAAVGHVVRNRVADRPTGTGICDVVYEPGQFGWTRKVPRRQVADAIGADQRWQNAATVADGVLAGMIPDPTAGARSFYSVLQYGKRSPKWARGMTRTARIGNHVFLR
ncbi:cell wall hydrolase [Zavarzinia sp.]|uniref:cell wall hydrolase n=1 Tax=Zavarzinia sp. TaxID=2027920 RepID=UPI003561C27B